MATGTFRASSTTHRTQLFNQPSPNPTSWRKWKKFLTRITDKNLKLREPLRNWTIENLKCRRYPSFVYDRTNNILYQYSDATEYRPLQLRTPGVYQRSTTPTPGVQNPKGYPVYAKECGDNFIMWHNYSAPMPQRNPAATTFAEYIHTLPRWEQYLLESHQLHAPPHKILQHLNQASAIIASDGSVIDQSAAYGYVIASSSTTRRLITGNGPAFGHDPSSFRAEAYGALAAIRMLYQLAKFTDTAIEATTYHHIDNSSLVHVLEE